MCMRVGSFTSIEPLFSSFSSLSRRTYVPDLLALRERVRALYEALKCRLRVGHESDDYTRSMERPEGVFAGTQLRSRVSSRPYEMNGNDECATKKRDRRKKTYNTIIKKLRRGKQKRNEQLNNEQSSSVKYYAEKVKNHFNIEICI